MKMKNMCPVCGRDVVNGKCTNKFCSYGKSPLEKMGDLI